MDKKTIVSVAFTAAGVLAGLFVWRSVVRPNLGQVVGAKSGL